MAITQTISTRELLRQSSLVFDAKAYRVYLATNNGSLTAESTHAAWTAVEVAGGTGYAAVTGTLGTGVYQAGTGRVEVPAVTATFTATGAGFSYDTVVIRLGTETYVHSILVESPSITLAAGQSKTYTLTFAQNDA
jgi:hypothetical protein